MKLGDEVRIINCMGIYNDECLFNETFGESSWSANFDRFAFRDFVGILVGLIPHPQRPSYSLYAIRQGTRCVIMYPQHVDLANYARLYCNDPKIRKRYTFTTTCPYCSYEQEYNLWEDELADGYALDCHKCYREYNVKTKGLV